MAHTLQHRARVLALAIALAIGAIAVLVIAALFVVRTPWAEERARRLIVDRVSGALDGALVVDRIDGSLLGDVTLHGVAIVRDGLRVVEVDRVRVRYRPIRLWRDALSVDEVELVRPRVRLIEEAGGWNLTRLARARPAGTPAGEPASFSIDRLTLTEGWLEIRPRAGAPVTLADLEVQTSLEFRRGRLALDVTRGALRDPATGVAVTALSHTLALEDRRLTIDDLAIATAGSALTGSVALTIGGEWPDTRVDVTGQPVRVREIVPYFPALADLPPDLAVDLTARGTLSDLRTSWQARSSAGQVASRDMTVRLTPLGTSAAGAVDARGVDLAAWLANPRLSSRLNATGTVDLRVPAGAVRETVVDFAMRSPGVALLGYAATGVAVSGRYAGDRLDATASASAYGASVSTSVAWVRATGQVGLRGRYADADLRRLPPRLQVPALETDLAGVFEADGGADGWVATTTIESGTIEGGSIGAGAVAGIDTRGDAVAYRFDGDVAAIDLGRIAPAVPAAGDLLARLGGPITGRLRVDAAGASRETFTGHADVSLSDSVVSGVGLSSARLVADVADHALTATATFVATGVTNAAVGVTSVDFRADGAGHAGLRWPDIRVPFDPAHASATADLDLTKVSVRGVVLDAAQVEGQLASGRLSLARLEARGPSLAARAAGTLAFAGDATSALDYRIDLDDLTLAEPFAGRSLAGSAVTEGRLTGPADRPRASGTLQVRRLDTESVDLLSADVTYTVTLPDRDVARAVVDAAVDASFVDVSGTPVDRIAGSVTYGEGRMVVEARASQGPRTVELAGDLVPHPDHREVHVRRAALSAGGTTWSLPAGRDAVIEYAPDRLGIRQLTLTSGASRLDVEGVLGPAASAPLRVTSTGVRVEALQALWPGGRLVTGRVDGTALVTGSLRAPAVDASIWVTDGSVDGVAFDRLGGLVAYADRRLSVELQLAAGPLGNLTAVGVLPVGGTDVEGAPRAPAFDVTVQSTAVHLAFFQPLTSAVDRIAGTGRFDLRITGPARAPVLAGRVALVDAAFRVPATGVSYRNLDADLTIQEQTVTVDQLRIEDADGHPATVQGEVSVPGIAMPRDFDLRVTSDGFRVLGNRFGDVIISAELQAMGDLTTPIVVGTLKVDRGLIEASNVLDRLTARGYQPLPTGPPAGAPAPAQGAVPGDAGGPTQTPWERASLSITLDLPENVVVRGRDLRTRGGPIGLGDVNVTVGGALSLAKEPGEPLTVLGYVDVVRGQYQFQGRRFDIRRGSQIRFSGAPSNPILDVEAERLISGVTATVRITGTLDRPELVLSSNPPLDPGDVLSLIVFNQAMNALPSGDRVSLAARAGAIAVGAIATPLSDSVARALNLDMFEIRPSDSATGGAIVLGRQINDRLFVGFSQEFGTDDVSQVSFEVRLNAFLRLVTSFAQGSDRTQLARRAEAAGIDLIFIVR